MLLKHQVQVVINQTIYKRKTTAISLYKRDAVVLIKRERK